MSARAAPKAAAPRRYGRLALRIVIALALLALVIVWVDPQRLRAQLAAVDVYYFAAALVTAIVANLLSAWRWSYIARVLGLRAPVRAAVTAYAQGIAVNTLLPGATVGGDALRSVRLAKLGNPLAPSALSVLLDRASGLWVLCALSLVATVGIALWVVLGDVLAAGAGAAAGSVAGSAAGSAAGPIAGSAGPIAGSIAGSVTSSTAGAVASASSGATTGSIALAVDALVRAAGVPVLLLYIGGLILATALPFFPWQTPRVAAAAEHRWARVLARLAQMHALVLERRGALARSLLPSLGVQVLSAGTLWLCARAAAGDVAFLPTLAIAAPVFIAAALPISLGGFGPREFAAALAFPLIGATAQVGVAAAVLFGLTAVVQGVLAAPLLAFAPRAEKSLGAADPSLPSPQPSPAEAGEGASVASPPEGALAPSPRSPGEGGLVPSPRSPGEGGLVPSPRSRGEG
jgi:hypothetical protein